MRNWNNLNPNHSSSLSLFLLYLWGIETPKFTMLIDIRFQVFTLPMRNWNTRFAQSDVAEKYKFLLYLWGIETLRPVGLCLWRVKFLLYLWGIETGISSFKSPLLWRFYFTYEELKQSPKTHLKYSSFLFLLYLWGIETLDWNRLSCIVNWVFTLPMRNWNIPRIAQDGSGTYVFTLPMRNWNFPKTDPPPALPAIVFTLPMRNWNIAEAKKAKKPKKGFYFTYEELKPDYLTQKALRFCAFLLYLWGIETL